MSIEYAERLLVEDNAAVRVTPTAAVLASGFANVNFSDAFYFNWWVNASMSSFYLIQRSGSLLNFATLPVPGATFAVPITDSDPQAYLRYINRDSLLIPEKDPNILRISGSAYTRTVGVTTQNGNFQNFEYNVAGDKTLTSRVGYTDMNNQNIRGVLVCRWQALSGFNWFSNWEDLSGSHPSFTTVFVRILIFIRSGPGGSASGFISRTLEYPLYHNGIFLRTFPTEGSHTLAIIEDQRRGITESQIHCQFIYEIRASNEGSAVDTLETSVAADDVLVEFEEQWSQDSYFAYNIVTDLIGI